MFTFFKRSPEYYFTDTLTIISFSFLSIYTFDIIFNAYYKLYYLKK